MNKSLKRALEFLAVAIIVGIYSAGEGLGFEEYASKVIVIYLITALIFTVLDSFWESVKVAYNDNKH